MVMGPLELSRRDHADLAVETTMVEPVDVLGVSNSTSSRPRHGHR
jgi:hypothetical protein